MSKESSQRKLILIGVLIIVSTSLLAISHASPQLLAIVSVFLVWPLAPPPLLKVPPSQLLGTEPTDWFKRLAAEELISVPKTTIPRHLHHIVVGPLGINIPTEWSNARNSCLALHPNYTHHFWTDELAEEFLTYYYPNLLNVYRSYESYVQKSDALRYIVVYHYGGIFLDMDLVCLSSLEPLISILEHEVDKDEAPIMMAPQAHPVGVSNGFFIASSRHPVLNLMLNNIAWFHRNYLTSYVNIMFSTGCMYMSTMFQYASQQSSLRVLAGRENMLSGKKRTVLFMHLGSSSWHTADARILACLGSRGVLLFLGMGFGFVYFLVKTRRWCQLPRNKKSYDASASLYP